MRICVVFDCLYPYTIGGAERWYRNLAERLAASGHDVTYLTIEQWDEEPQVPGVRVLAVAPRMKLYAGDRRAIATQARFSGGVARHLVRHGRDYDVVHTAGLHLFLLAIQSVRRFGQFRVVADWHEVWTREYWHEYLGRSRGEAAWHVQALGARSRHTAFCFARLHARRLRECGYRGEPTVLEGEYAGDLVRPEPDEPEPVVVFAGRFIPEKQVPALVRAVAWAREQVPGLRAELYGDGPDRAEVLAQIERNALGDAVSAPGFVSRDDIDRAFRRALCLVLPSRREGYGLVVVEACAKGTPAIVVAGEDNAAVELVDDGVNGFVAKSSEPHELGAAIVRAYEGRTELRRSTADWFARNARRLSLESSLERVLEAYGDGR